MNQFCYIRIQKNDDKLLFHFLCKDRCNEPCSKTNINLMSC